MATGNVQDVLNFLISELLSFSPISGSQLSLAFDVASMMYEYMATYESDYFLKLWQEIEGTNQYIIADRYTFVGFQDSGTYIGYSVGSGYYYGSPYNRGQFIEMFLIAD